LAACLFFLALGGAYVLAQDLSQIFSPGRLAPPRLLAGPNQMGVLAGSLAKKASLSSATSNDPKAFGSDSASSPLVTPLTKKDLATLIGPRSLALPDPRFLAFKGPEGQDLFAETTFDSELQTKALDWLKKTRAKRAALVVMNPFDGEVLALAGYRDDGFTANPALAETFPAASLIKIVTAAAALEEANYETDSLVAYDGGKHTLYKANVIKKPNQGRKLTTLKESFAESNNAVFGKLGAFDLGAADLSAFANRFYFNQPMDFEAPLAVSSFTVRDSDDLFRLAELASGFNRATRIGPLHGAALAGVALTGGLIYEPTMAREIFDRDNNVYYQSKTKLLGRAMSQTGATELKELMEATVSLGTGRRHFSDADQHPLLSGLTIGGKTGTINDVDGTRVEWFVAFSYWPESGSGPVWPLALAAVVASEGKAPVDGQDLIRRALIAYYQPLLDGSGRTYR
jgi:hypothetical protein